MLLVFFLLSTRVMSAPSEHKDIQALIEVVKFCVFKKDTAHPVFRGCIDWHSAVHGNWALLWGADILNDHKLTALVLNQLTVSGLNQELRDIQLQDGRDGPIFEMPYGRAWFLQLARDAEILHKFHGLRPLADYLYSTLMHYARDRKGELIATDYDNASWYLYQLYRWAKYNGYRNDEQTLKRIVIERYSNPTHWPRFTTNRGFFEPKAMAVLLLSAMSKPEPSWNALINSINAEPLQPRDPPFVTAHQAGLNYSRTWGLIALAQATKDQRYAVAVQQHRKMMSENIKHWAPRYQEYSHWIGQFGMFSYRIEHGD